MTETDPAAVYRAILPEQAPAIVRVGVPSESTLHVEYAAPVDGGDEERASAVTKLAAAYVTLVDGIDDAPGRLLAVGHHPETGEEVDRFGIPKRWAEAYLSGEWDTDTFLQKVADVNER